MKILVVGNITIDRSYKVQHLPQPGETIIAEDSLTNIGGKGVNQAIMAARSGMSVKFISAVGKETDNNFILSYLDKVDRLDHDLFEKYGNSDESIINISKTGENTIVSTNNCARSIQAQEVEEYITNLETDDILLLQGNLSEETTHYCIQQAHSQNAEIVINLAPVEFDCKEVWPKIDYLVINEAESQILSGKDEPAEAAKFLINSSVKNVIVTLGPKGALLAKRDGGVTKISAADVEVKDTTGAGDAFTGVFVAGLSQRLDAKTACKWASQVAGLCVSKTGTSSALPSPGEITDIYKKTV